MNATRASWPNLELQYTLLSYYLQLFRTTKVPLSRARFSVRLSPPPSPSFKAWPSTPFHPASQSPSGHTTVPTDRLPKSSLFLPLHSWLWRQISIDSNPQNGMQTNSPTNHGSPNAPSLNALSVFSVNTPLTSSLFVLSITFWASSLLPTIVWVIARMFSGVVGSAQCVQKLW